MLSIEGLLVGVRCKYITCLNVYMMKVDNGLFF